MSECLIKKQAVQISPTFLFDILKPGIYNGGSKYTPTKKYPNGLICQNTLKIEQNLNGVSFINKVLAYDNVTKKFQYTGIRIGEFFYKIHHGDNLFKTSKSYINGNIVSSSYGFATDKSPNSISFELSGSWHINDTDYHIINHKIIKNNNHNHQLIVEFYHPGDMKFDEFYTLIS
jgi:hypothetical protein